MKNSHNGWRIKLLLEVEMFFRNVEHIVSKNIPAGKFLAIFNMYWGLEHSFEQICGNCCSWKKFLLLICICSILYSLFLETCLNLFIYQCFSRWHVSCKATLNNVKVIAVEKKWHWKLCWFQTMKTWHDQNLSFSTWLQNFTPYAINIRPVSTFFHLWLNSNNWIL